VAEGRARPHLHAVLRPHLPLRALPLPDRGGAGAGAASLRDAVARGAQSPP
jgi:hypothetical protein